MDGTEEQPRLRLGVVRLTHGRDIFLVKAAHIVAVKQYEDDWSEGRACAFQMASDGHWQQVDQTMEELEAIIYGS